MCCVCVCVCVCVVTRQNGVIGVYDPTRQRFELYSPLTVAEGLPLRSYATHSLQSLYFFSVLICSASPCVRFNVAPAKVHHYTDVPSHFTSNFTSLRLLLARSFSYDGCWVGVEILVCDWCGAR
jgi:hypothetical protein